MTTGPPARVALVTGSSRGLGSAIAIRLGRDGFAVAVDGLHGMRAAGFGRIVHIDSEVADRPPVARSAYVVAKSAQIALARSWAHELAQYGITVNTVAPGFVPVERHSDVPADERAAYVRTVPAGRIGRPADVAGAVSMLASRDADFITGQRILVDGGRSLVI